MRAVVLKMRDNITYYEKYSHTFDDALAFADASYNGGIGGLDRERRACKIDSKCDHTRWFGNVENFCLKSKAVLYGNRSACDINRYHVKDVLITRANKYKPFFVVNQETIWPVPQKPVIVTPTPTPIVEPVVIPVKKPEEVSIPTPQKWWEKLLQAQGLTK